MGLRLVENLHPKCLNQRIPPSPETSVEASGLQVVSKKALKQCEAYRLRKSCLLSLRAG